MFPANTAHIPIVQHENGTIYIEGTRVAIDIVIEAFKQGASAEEIVHRFTSLQLSDVYAVITYYLQNTADIETYLAERQALSDTVRQQNEARFNPTGLRERLLARNYSAPHAPS